MSKPLLHKTPIRWSALSCFEYSPEQWFEQYILKRPNVSKEMTFGTEVDERIQNDPSFLPMMPRYPLMQHRMEAKFGKLTLQGTADGVDLLEFILADYKTGKKAWDQKRTDEHGQLLMYLLLLWLTEGAHPENFTCRIHWMPTRDTGDFRIEFTNPKRPIIHTFETTHTMREMLEFGERINRVSREMEAYLQAKIANGALSTGMPGIVK